MTEMNRQQSASASSASVPSGDQNELETASVWVGPVANPSRTRV